MISYIIFAHIAAFAFSVSLAVSGFMRLFKIIDIPNARSSHSLPMPTAGGVGIVAGMAAAMIGLHFSYTGFVPPVILGGLAALGLAVAALGLIDDIYNLPPRFKFVVIVLISLATPFVTGATSSIPFGFRSVAIAPELGYAGAALWVFVVMNIVNFMDGANGLMGAVMMIATAGLCAIGIMIGMFEIAIVSVALVAALFGFVVYNYRKVPKIFSGDVGSLFVGFVFAALVLRLTSQPRGAMALYAGPLLFLPFLTDGLLTLLVRAKHKEPILQAHHRHIYQRMIRAGKSHMQVTFRYMMLTFICAVLTLAGVSTGLMGSVFYLLICVTLGNWVYLRAYRKLERAED